MPKILIVQYPGWKAHISGDHNFWTAHEQVIKFSGFSFLDKYIHLTKIQQNPWGSGGKFFKIQVILHGMTLLFFILGKLFPFYHQPKKLKIEKKKKKEKKKCLKVTSFYTSAPKIMIIFWDMAHDRSNCYFSFWAIFCSFTL